jgi:hypothetical protein
MGGNRPHLVANTNVDTGSMEHFIECRMKGAMLDGSFSVQENLSFGCHNIP